MSHLFFVLRLIFKKVCLVLSDVFVLAVITANVMFISKQANITHYVHQYLQGERQANEVHHHLFVGQLHAEKTQQSEESLVVLPTAALLLAA